MTTEQQTAHAAALERERDAYLARVRAAEERLQGLGPEADDDAPDTRIERLRAQADLTRAQALVDGVDQAVERIKDQGQTRPRIGGRKR